MSTTGAKDRFKRAEQAARKGNYEYAIELYLQGLTLDPKATERSRLHQVEALAIEEQGGNPEGNASSKMKVMGIRGRVKKLSMQKKWDEVIPELEKAIRTQPRSSPLLVQLADALVKIEAGDSAIDVLEEVVNFDSHNVDAMRRLGSLWSERDEVEKAIGYWEKVRQHKPDDKEAAKAIRDLSAQSMVKKAEARKAEAGDDSFKALLADEDKAADLEQEGKVIRTDEDRRAAIKRKKEEIKKEPTNSRLWRELGGLFQDLREYKHAGAAYKKALEVNPQDLFARDKIGNLKEQLLEDQVEGLRKKVEAAGNNGAAEELRTQLATKEKEFLVFRTKEYGRRVKEHPTDYQLKMQYGALLMESELFDEAIRQFQNAVKDPKFKVQAQNKMGMCFYRKGVFAVAIGQFQQALDGVSDPDSDVAKDIRYNLGVANQEGGKTAEALQFFQDIMSVDIGYRDVSERVDQLMNAQG